ncbi:GNAT family N-acetyltransferase [Zhengella sp. ZM62]|uniref:GNAT family N-acetyltransferase n=1 Tax=Zhengella sedimenti TaxID=3390035 RepID=UPI00397629AA
MVLIRPCFHDRELAECLGIWRRASEVGHPFLDRTTLDGDEVLVRDQYMPAAEIYVAEVDGMAVGFIAMLGDVVGGLFVDPSFHQQGIGRALIGHVAVQHDELKVEVYEANTRARAFYTACAFVETGRRDRDDQDRPLPLIRMQMAKTPVPSEEGRRSYPS